MLLPHISIYINIYQFNQIYGKGVGQQVRKLSNSPLISLETKAYPSVLLTSMDSPENCKECCTNEV